MSPVRPWLWVSPALAHRISPPLLQGLGSFLKTAPPRWRPLNWRGLDFPNRVGVAGGIDKDARNVRAWWGLGAGFIEIGTVTPRPQPGNTPPVVARDVSREALWNRLGFPSEGAARVRDRLRALPTRRPTPVFANIGKNAATPLESATADYLEVIAALRGLVDGFVINVSSPNTKGLRDLLKPDRLRAFLSPILETKREPILLKLSPDTEDEELARTLEISADLGVDGWILTNSSQNIRDGLDFPKEGGVSGRPLADHSKRFLERTLELLGPRREDRLIVSVGGIMSGADVTERLALGADLVEAYTALIFEGPWFFRKVARWHSRNP